MRDVEAKARAWSEILGLPMPNIIITDTVDKTQAEYIGKPMPARVAQTLDFARHPIPEEMWARLEVVGYETKDL